MLTITIIDNSNEDLILEVDGKRNNGFSTARKNEQVRWEVRDGSGVRKIEAITIKNIGGNNNIFSSNPPREEDAQKKKWKGTVNGTVRAGDVYVYNIVWIKDDATGTEHTYDPIISIKPKIAISLQAIVATSVAVVSAIAYLSYQIYKLKYGK